jgi:hypothetical protein
MPVKESVKKYCSLSKYLEQKDKSLFEVIESLCLSYLLRPDKGTTGITFLYPTDKKYIQKIVNFAYSEKPEEAVNMIKSLVLHNHHKNLESFGEKVVNRLNQKIDVKKITDKEAILVDKITIAPDKKFIPLGRDNVAVYLLSGGEIPLNGTTVQIERQLPTKGGSASSRSLKKKLHKVLEEGYLSEFGAVDNIYVKKVYLQLKYINKHVENSPSVLYNYLGNDEFSDSYLLDIYCNQKHPGCFSELLEALTESHRYDLNKITKAHYIKEKRAICNEGAPNKYVHRDANRMKGIQNPAEFRGKIYEAYNNDKPRIAKDLFIVFCNTARDLWQSCFDGKDDFRNFVYIASNIYTDPLVILKQGFDIAVDMSSYGTLLKSDVFLYHPQASFNQDEVPYPIPDLMPAPINLSLFSLCGFINKPARRPVSGGSVNVRYLFEDLDRK